MSTGEIAILLPSREGFCSDHFGAISLCVRDFVEHSEFREACTIFGAVSETGFSGIPYQYLPVRTSFLQSRNRRYIRAFERAMVRTPPKLVEVHNRPILVRDLARRWQGKIALHLHNDPQKMKYARKVEERRVLLSLCSAIYCVSDYIKERFLEGVADEGERIHTVYNGLKLPVAQRHKQKQITFVGRLQPEKGALEFVQALQQLLPDYEGWKGVIIGAARHDPDSLKNPYEKQIQHILQETSLPIEIRGFCTHEQTMQTLAESEISVIPSLWNEAFGRTALEAMACGCATISSTRGGLAEVVGQAAYRLEEISPRSIAGALRELIEKPDLRAALQQQGVKQAQKFEIQTCTNELDAIRRTILKSE